MSRIGKGGLVSLAQRLRAKKAGLSNPKPSIPPKPKKPGLLSGLRKKKPNKKQPKNKLTPPEKGKKPKRITTEGPAGGPHTPGAKAGRRSQSFNRR